MFLGTFGDKMAFGETLWSRNRVESLGKVWGHNASEKPKAGYHSLPLIARFLVWPAALARVGSATASGPTGKHGRIPTPGFVYTALE